MHIRLRILAAMLVLIALPSSAAALTPPARPAQLSNLTVASIAQEPGSRYVLTATRLEPLCPDTGAGFHCLGMREVRYAIVVTASTKLLDRDRKPLADRIAVGDRINAYGPLAGERMTAEIVRDLNLYEDTGMRIAVTSGKAQFRSGLRYSVKFAVTGGTAPYRWQAKNLPPGMQLTAPGPIYCIAAPCPQPSADTARIKGSPTRAGSYDAVVTVIDARGTALDLAIPLVVTE